METKNFKSIIKIFNVKSTLKSKIIKKNQLEYKSYEIETYDTKQNKIFNEIRSTEPLESILQALNICKLKTLLYYFKLNKQFDLNEMTINTNGEFDMGRFLGSTPGPIKFSYVNLQVDVLVNSTLIPNKIDLIEYSNKCPVYNMIKFNNDVPSSY